MKKLLILLFLSTSFSTFADWKLSKQVNDFEEKTYYFLMSDEVVPNRPLSWPNDDAYAYMYFQCVANNFTLVLTASQFAKKTIQDGYDSVSFDAKIEGVEIKKGLLDSLFGVNTSGNGIRSVSGSQDWGSDHIRIGKFDSKRLKFVDATKIIFQINHYVDGKRIYEFDMNGFDINLCDVNN
jgi:hypothetical protein